MDKAVLQQFLDFFQDFVNLCQHEHWPEDDTSETEIKNAFLASQHVEKCLDKLQKNNLIDNFLAVVNDKNDNSNNFIKSCFCDPPKFIMKKIINSKAKVVQMDVAFRIFLELYSEQKLENCLTDLMVEAASKETLLRNLSELPKEKVMHLKCSLFLSELYLDDDAKETVLEMLRNSDQGTIDLLVLCLLNNDMKYNNVIAKVKDALFCVMSSKASTYQKFWKFLLNVDYQHLIEMCIEHSDLFKMVSKALIDCSKLLREHMSSDFFYINLTYSELVAAVQKLCHNVILKEDFFTIVTDKNSDLEFWFNMLS